MLKKMMMGCLLVLLACALLSGCEKKGDTTASPEQGEVKETMNQGKSNSLPNDLPAGFPSSVPLYKGAQIIEADTYGQDGYTVVYAVAEPYHTVVDFYVDAFGLDSSGIEDDAAYFEGMDIEDVHINGLTIEAAGEKTQVYITLRDYGKEGSEEDAASDSDDSSSILYDSAIEVKLDQAYPSDVVPIYSGAKIIDCSLVPDGSGSGFVSLVLPSDAYDKAVKFYQEKLGLTPKQSKSQLMVSDNFKGEVKGYKISVTVGQAVKSDPNVTITLDKR